MAKKEGYIIDLNKLWRYEDGNLIRPRMLWANGKEYFAAFSNGSLSYNKAYYEFYLEDTELVALASGVIMDSYVYTSQKTNFDGKVTNIGVTDTLGYIEPNYSLTEEINTGNKWVDGKTIYKMTYYVSNGAPTTSWTDIDVSLSKTNNRLIKVEGNWSVGQVTSQDNNGIFDIYERGMFENQSINHPRFRLNSAFQYNADQITYGINVYVTLYYTKLSEVV